MTLVEPVLTWESVSHVIGKYDDGRTSATTWESVSNVTGKYDDGRTRADMGKCQSCNRQI